MSFFGLSDDQLIAIWTTRAAEIAAAAKQAADSALGVAASENATLTDAISRSTIDTAQKRTITLELRVDSAPSLEPLVAILTFDIYTGPSVDAFPQRIETTMSARQSEHQTAVGFYIDEFNESIGTLSVDVLVIFNQAPQQQIQNFFDLLHKAKLTTPLANETPMKLRFHDSYLQRSYVITQRDIHLSQTTEMLGFARLTISAGILQDYSSPQQILPSVTALQDNTPNIASSAILALQDFEGPGGIEDSAPPGVGA